MFAKLFKAKEEAAPLYCCALVVAAGSATRMEGIDKIRHELGGFPVLIHALRPFEASDLVQEIMIVTQRESILEIAQLCRTYGIQKVTKILPGGATRSESVSRGLQELGEAVTHVAIHDGARPFATQALVEEVILAAEECGAAAPAIPLKDTIKLVKDGLVQETLPRAQLCAVQTPQVFARALICEAMRHAMADGAQLTDDCSAVERLGAPVAMTRGSEENMKLTTPHDMAVGACILAGRDYF